MLCNVKRMSTAVFRTFRISNMTEQHSTHIFQGRQDRFKGITVDSRREPCDLDTFSKKLTESLTHWKKEQMRGIWFKVALQQADWVPVLAKNEFHFHHARNEEVVMVRWLPETQTCNIPPYCHTMLSVGGLVTDSQNRILVVKERMALISFWKLPGGYIEEKEDISDAVEREILEETGVQTKFNSLLGFMHSHTSQFGCSDIYLIAHLLPVDENQPIKKCEREIQDCCWIKIEDYLQDPEVIELNKKLVKEFLIQKEASLTMPGKKYPHPIFQDKHVTIFTLKSDSKAARL